MKVISEQLDARSLKKRGYSFGAVVSFALALILAGNINPIADCKNRVLGQHQSSENYRVRRIDIRGAAHFTVQQIKEACGMRPDSILKEGFMQACRQNLTQTYASAGFIKVTVEIQPVYAVPNPGDREGLVDLLVSISEGPKYTIGRIEFEGNSNTRHRVLQRAIGLNLGDPYDPSQKQKWIRSLNRLRRFWIVAPGDVEVEIDEDNHLVYLRFHVREKSKPRS